MKKITKYILQKEAPDKNYMIEVNFVSSKIMRKINNEYRNIDKETDIISLSFKPDGVLNVSNTNYILLGEIYISPSFVKKQAKKYNNTFFYELFFLYIHGLLHLLGYDHIRKIDSIIMINKHKEILKNNLWIKNNY